jgi:hypothetical protein
VRSEGVLGGASGDFSLGASRVISKQLHNLICVQRDNRIPAMIPTIADEHAAIINVMSVALNGMDGGGVAM